MTFLILQPLFSPHQIKLLLLALLMELFICCTRKPVVTSVCFTQPAKPIPRKESASSESLSDSPLYALYCPQECINALAFTHSSRYLATGGRDGLLKVWDMKTKTVHKVLKVC